MAIVRRFRMARRTYVPTLLRVAEAMCKYIAAGTPIITKLYPTNAALLAALAAANAACQALAEELAQVREFGD